MKLCSMQLGDPKGDFSHPLVEERRKKKLCQIGRVPDEKCLISASTLCLGRRPSISRSGVYIRELRKQIEV